MDDPTSPYRLVGINHYLHRLAGDERLQFELEAAQKHGVGHSVFLGWPEDDQDKAMAFILHERMEDAKHCQYCGQLESDWVDERGRFFDPPLYEAVSNRCPGCEALNGVAKDIPDENRPYTRAKIQPVPE